MANNREHDEVDFKRIVDLPNGGKLPLLLSAFKDIFDPKDLKASRNIAIL